MTFVPTPQQEMAAHYFCDGMSMSLEALAGTGKTSTLFYLANHPQRPKGRILYTAFGKRVIEEAKAKFPGHVSVRTNHSLAWQYGKPYNDAGRLVGRITPTTLIEHPAFNENRFKQNPITVSRWIMLTINRYVESSDDELRVIHALPAVVHAVNDSAEAVELAREVVRQAKAIWAAMMDMKNSMPITHDVYLKKWALTRPKLPYDIILLDEGQDANPVIVDVIRQQTHAQLIVVGDRQQAIFGFRGAIDAMDSFDVQANASLTMSFRFGPQIAMIANKILEVDCESSMRIEGDSRQPGRIAQITTQRHAIIARTNATLVKEIVRQRIRNPSLKLGAVNGVKDLIDLCKSVDLLFLNQRPRYGELTEFSSWEELKAAAEHEAYAYLRKLVTLVEDIGTAKLIFHLESIRGNETDEASCHLLYTTAHSAKGREWDQVKLANDYPLKGPPGQEFDDGWTPEEANLLYVACTRARVVLDPIECDAVSLAWGGNPWPT